MKKFFVLLLIVTLAAFVFTGCTPPAEGEGEGEGEGEPEVLGIVIEGAVTIDGREYVKGGKGYDITITFDTPRTNVVAEATACVGDLSKANGSSNDNIPLWPSADRKVWTGNYIFDCDCEGSNCCVTQIFVSYGECDTCYVTSDPIIVDCAPPEIGPVEICIEECDCEGCALVFKSENIAGECADKLYCKDACSGFAGWTIALYKKNPFDDCCDTPCYEPICSGEGDCRVEWTSCCLDEGSPNPVFVLITFMDNVGHKVKWLASVDVDYSNETCKITEVEEKLIIGKVTQCTDTPDFKLCQAQIDKGAKITKIVEECP